MESNTTNASASLRIFGTGLDFDHISRVLNTTPTATSQAGSVLPSGRPTRFDLWEFSSTLPKTVPLDAHLRFVRQQFKGSSESLGQIRGTQNITQTSLFCGTITENQCSFELSREVLTFLSLLSMEVELSCVFVGSPIQTAGGSVSSDVPDTGPTNRKDRTDVSLELTLSAKQRELQILRKFVSQVVLPDARLRMDDGTEQWLLRVPKAAGHDAESQLRWLQREISEVRSSAVRNLHWRFLSLLCRVSTTNSWGSSWLSPQALDACLDLQLPLRFNAQLV
jgi:hypothetical protein